MNIDPLSDLLGAVRLRGAVFYYVSFNGPWAAQSPPSLEFAQLVMPGSSHVMEFHMILRGTGWATVEGEDPVALSDGDIIVFPHGDGHVLSSARGLKPQLRDNEWVAETREVPKPIPIMFYNGTKAQGHLPTGVAAEAVVVCGFLGCEVRPFNPLLESLPRVMHLPSRSSDPWITRLIDQAAQESNNARPGGNAVLQRLSEMMFVDTVRRYVETLPEGANGWLSGLRDRYVGRALSVMHEKPAHPWTVDDLGREVGLSRSALHERFMQTLGQPPSQYLANWRMQVGSRMLRDTHHPVAAIAQEVGYASEAAFSRAFKRMVGQPPAAWRRNGQVSAA